MFRLLLPVLIAIMTAGVSYAGHAVTHDYQIEARLADLAVADHRSSGHIARNPSRHPVETLMFFGIKPDMTVVEISPGGSGWYTEILAPFLRDHGVYHVGSYDPQSEREYYRRNAVKYNNKLAEFPEIYDRVQVGIFEPPGKTDTVAEGTADMVLTFRNSHNWLRAGVGQQSYDAFYRMLKPGGIFGVVQHRARPGTDVDPAKGYITEEQIISMAQKAGFSLQASSQVNANPMDTADHPEGVWTLPPSLRLKEVDREKYLAIGESDRMTLKFIKD